MSNIIHSDPSADASPRPLDRGPLAVDDPRYVFARAVALGSELIGSVPATALDGPTPCDDFDTRALLGHLVAVLRRVAAMGRAENALALPIVVTGIGDDAWLEAWLGAAHEVQSAWTDDSVLTRVITLPWAVLPGGPMLGRYTSEVLTHLWDLATATGQHPAWDDEIVRPALDAARQALPAVGRLAGFHAAVAAMPPEMRPTSAPFGEAVEVASDAPLIEQLVAWNGRRP